jgi:hypothetical protein
MTTSDLQAQGEKYGWTARHLTLAEIEGMSSSELKWHEHFNRENLENVFAIETKKKHNREVMKVVDTRRMWEGKASQGENEVAYKVADEFAQRYPAFVRHTENANAVCAYMRDHNLDATRIDSYVEALTDLAMQGAITLSPKDAGVGPESRLSGSDLRNYPRLHLLLQPHRVLTVEEKMSANEYYNAHPELHDTRIPPLIARRQQVEAKTAEHFQKATNTEIKGAVVRIFDYETKS